MNLVQHYRKKAGLTQSGLADKANCKQPSLSAIEAGSIPGVDLAQRIVSALNDAGVDCSIDEVFPPSEVA